MPVTCTIIPGEQHIWDVPVLINPKKPLPETGEIPTLDQLQAGLFFLMHQYTFRQCPKIAEKIVEHLAMLCNHPDISLLPSQYRLYASMINTWRARQGGSLTVCSSRSVH